MARTPPAPGTTAVPVRIAVLSDTHLPARTRTLPQAAVTAIRSADLVIHAGDVSDMTTLAQLRAIGPALVAVHGNADDDEVRGALPATAEVDAGGVRIGLTHNGGPEAGRLARLRRRFPGCDVVVFGHSHIPLHAVDGDFRIVNPGSAADRRRQPHHSMALITVADGVVADVAFLRLDPPAGPLDATLVRTTG